MNLSELQVRVIGALMEKEKTTPDQYPLSLNSLTNACNQKSSRDPVMQLSDSEVLSTISELLSENLAAEVLFGSRVTKYKHRFCNTEFSPLQLTNKEQAIICVLFLRGAQTAGEIKTRTQRMCDFANVGEVEKVLKDLQAGSPLALVIELPRESGKREVRFTHVFNQKKCEADHTSSDNSDKQNNTEHTKPVKAQTDTSSSVPDYQAQIDMLTARVEALEALWQSLND